MKFYQRLLRDNGGWIIGLAGLAGTALAFALGGPVVGEIGVGLLLVTLILALGKTAFSEHKQLEQYAHRESVEAERTVTPSNELTSEEEASISVAEPVSATSEEQRTEGVEDTAILLSQDETNGGSGESPFSRLLSTARNGPVHERRERLEEYVAMGADQADQVARRASGLWLLAVFGDSLAIPDLRQLANSHPTTEVLNQLIAALRAIDGANAALQELRSRLPLVVSFSDGQQLRLTELDLLRQVSQHNDVVELAAELFTLSFADLDLGTINFHLGMSLYELDRFDEGGFKNCAQRLR